MIGSNLAKRLVQEGNDVYIVDNLWRGKLEYLNDNSNIPIINLNTNFINADLRSYEACLSATKGMDVVIHLADIVAGINFVFTNQLFLWRANVLINSNVLAAAIESKVKKYIYVGTACSFPKSKQSYINPPPFKEEDVYPAEPESAYGWSKLMGEYEGELAQSEGFIETGILRLHNVYGPPCELDPQKSQVIPALCRKAIRYPEEPFVVWGSGNQRRAFVHVDDVVEALCLLNEKGMGQGAIQIGPAQSHSIKEIAEQIVRISGKDLEIVFDVSRPEGDMDRMADYSKAQRILGWEPRVTLADGLAATYAWAERALQKKA